MSAVPPNSPAEPQSMSGISPTNAKLPEHTSGTRTLGTGVRQSTETQMLRMASRSVWLEERRGHSSVLTPEESEREGIRSAR